MGLLQLNKLPPSCNRRLRAVCVSRARGGCSAAPRHRPLPIPGMGSRRHPQTRGHRPVVSLSLLNHSVQRERSTELNSPPSSQQRGPKSHRFAPKRRQGGEGVSLPSCWLRALKPYFPLPPSFGGSGSLQGDDLRLHPHRSAPLRTSCRGAATSRGALPGVSGPGCLVRGQAQVFPSWERAGRLTQLCASGRGSSGEGAPGFGCTRTAQARLGPKKLQASPVGLNPNHFSLCFRAFWSQQGSDNSWQPPQLHPSLMPPQECRERGRGAGASGDPLFGHHRYPVHISWSTRSQGLTPGKGNQHLCPHVLSTPTPLISLSGAGKPPHSSPIKAGDEDFCAPAAFPHGTTQDTRRGPSPGYLRPVSGGALAEVGHVGGGDVTHGRFPKQPPG